MAESETWISGKDFKFKTPLRSESPRLTGGNVRSPINTRRRATLAFGKLTGPLLVPSDEEGTPTTTITASSFYKRSARASHVSKHVTSTRQVTVVENKTFSSSNMNKTPKRRGRPTKISPTGHGSIMKSTTVSVKRRKSVIKGKLSKAPTSQSSAKASTVHSKTSAKKVKTESNPRSSRSTVKVSPMMTKPARSDNTAVSRRLTRSAPKSSQSPVSATQAKSKTKLRAQPSSSETRSNAAISRGNSAKLAKLGSPSKAKKLSSKIGVTATQRSPSQSRKLSSASPSKSFNSPKAVSPSQTQIRSARSALQATATKGKTRQQKVASPSAVSPTKSSVSSVPLPPTDTETTPKLPTFKKKTAKSSSGSAIKAIRKRSVATPSPQVVKSSKGHKTAAMSDSPVKDMSQHIKEIIDEKATKTILKTDKSGLATVSKQTNKKTPSKTATPKQKVSKSPAKVTKKVISGESSAANSVTPRAKLAKKSPKGLLAKQESDVNKKSRRSIPNPAMIADEIEKEQILATAKGRRKSTPGVRKSMAVVQTSATSVSRKRQSKGKVSFVSTKLAKLDRSPKKIVRKPTPNRVSKIFKVSDKLDYSMGDNSLLYATPDARPLTRFQGDTPFHTPLVSHRTGDIVKRPSLLMNDTMLSTDDSAIDSEYESDEELTETPAAAKSWCSIM